MTPVPLLVACPPDHYALRNLKALSTTADVRNGNPEEFVSANGPTAEVLLYSGLGGESLPFAKVWPSVPQVKWVHSLSAGVEKFAIPEFVQSPVPLTNARGVFKRPLAEFAILGILFFSKRLRRLIHSQAAHRWDNFYVDLLPGKIMGIVGYGEIGRECAILAKALGMKIHAVRRKPQQSASDPIVDRVYGSSELREMLAHSDVVVTSAPLTAETHHMLSDAEFALMKASAIVINVGRGPVIHEDALVRALQSGKIAGAALDVFEKEPLAAASPLWDMENVLISPHCTDRTQNPDWLDMSMQFFLENFERYRTGRPLENIVDKKAGY
jgi:phosphoglycerate dehydrogenase-like enzyme